MLILQRQSKFSLPRLVHTYPKPKKEARKNILIKRLKQIECIKDVQIYIPAISEYKHDTEVKFIFTLSIADNIQADKQFFDSVYNNVKEIIFAIHENFSL